MYVHIEVEPPEGLDEEIQSKVDDAMDRLGEEVEWEWRRIAARDLAQSKDEYLNGMSVEVIDGQIIMKVTGPLAIAVEGGSEKFDLKPGFLKGKTSATIPLFGNRPPNIDRLRTVPSKTKPWIHPGIKARNLIDKVTDKVEEQLLDEVFNGIIGRTTI